MLKIISKRWNPGKFKEIGRGGEAVIYQLRPDTVAKVFLRPEAPELKNDHQSQQAARVKLEEIQTKLYEFPASLPAALVVPTGVLLNAQGRIFGYTMPLIDGTSLDKMSKTTGQIPPHMQSALLCNLYDAVSALHACGVVIGDFNENNIIVANGAPQIIDADSMQFGSYQCKSFTPRFTDPEILTVDYGKPSPKKGAAKKSNTTPGCDCPNCREKRRKKAAEANKQDNDKANPAPISSFRLTAPHSELTDWYSLLVIAMRLTTLTEPFGGTVENMPLPQRIKDRVSIFNPNVVYPVIAKPLREIPRPLLEVFFKFFHLGQRFVPDRKIFEAIN